MAMQHRRDTAANIASTDPHLRMGEAIVATDDAAGSYIGDGLHKPSEMVPLEPRSGVIKIGHEVLTLAAAQIDITIPDRDDLTKLEIWIRARGVSGTSLSLFCRLNGITTSHYDDQNIQGSAVSVAAAASRAVSRIYCGLIPGDGGEANQWSTTIIEIPFPRKVGPWRTFTSRSGNARGTASGNLNILNVNGWLRKGMKIDSVRVYAGVDLMAATEVLTLGWIDN